LKKIKLLKSWTHEGRTFGPGTLLEVDEDTVKNLIADGTAIEYDPEAEKAAEEAKREQEEATEKLISSAVERAMVAQKKLEKKTTVIEVKSVVDPKGGFKNFGHFASDVYKSCIGRDVSPSMKDYSKKQILQEGDDAQGGFLVPVEFAAKLLQTALERTIMVPRATFVPMSTNRINIPAMYDEDHTGGEFFGGVTIHRTGETQQKEKSKPTFGEVQLNLHKITGLAAVTDSLLEDSAISIEPILMKTFGAAMAYTMDDDFINGDGAGKPVGFLQCAALVTVDKEAAQVADTIVAENVLKMYARMPEASKFTAVWVANHNTLPQLATMTIGTQPVFIPAGGLTQKPHDTLLGRPLLWTEKVPTIGDANDLNFIDPEQYLIGGKSAGLTPKVDVSIHLWFDYDLTAFRFVLRYDGVCWWRSAMTPQNGDPMSPFITLAERA